MGLCVLKTNNNGKTMMFEQYQKNFKTNIWYKCGVEW